MKLRNLRAALVALSLLCSAAVASAQTIVAPQAGVGGPPQPSITATFSSSALALVPAASATDLACISPSATKTVRVTRLQASAVGSAIITQDLSVVLRSTLDTAGTAASTTANPANNIISLDPSVDGTATATLISYTANPTTGTLAGIIRTQKLVANISVQAVGTAPPAVFDFGIRGGKGVVLRKGSTYQLCLNLNGGTIAAPLVDVDFEWTEE